MNVKDIDMAEAGFATFNHGGFDGLGIHDFPVLVIRLLSEHTKRLNAFP